MKKNSEKSDGTPLERFTQAAQHIFCLPKSDVKKIKAETPPPKKHKKK